jgi:streptogrisin C
MTIRRHTTRGPALAVAAALVLASAGTLGVGAAQATKNERRPARSIANGTPAASTAPLSLTQVAQSVQYLTRQYGVSTQEALRRLELQRGAAALADKLRKELPGAINGVWLDQAHGGVLTVATTRPEQATAAIGSVPDRAHVRVKPSRWSLAQLEATAKRVTDQARKEPGRIAGAHVDVARDAVVVLYNQTGTGPSATSARGFVADLGSPAGMLQVAAAPKTTSKGVPKMCTTRRCDTPIRGGVRLDVKRANGSWGACTNGFNIGDSRGWAYTLTAGHCALKSGLEGQTFYYHNALPVSQEHTDGNFAKNEPPKHDYAALPFQSFGGTPWWVYWLTNRWGINRVHSQCVTSAYGCSSGSYYMRGWYTWDQIQVGWVVCATGSGDEAVYPDNYGYIPGTRCGEIQSKKMVNYDREEYWWWETGRGLKANICGRDGDSGGPLFSEIDSMGYGILSGGNEGTGDCYTGETAEYGVYAPLSEIFDDLHSRTGLGFGLITSTTW